MVQRDLSAPSRAVGRRELPLLFAIAVVTVVVAQWNEPGTPFDLSLVALASVALVLPGLLGRVPSEVFAALVAVPVCFAVGHQGHLELSIFLIATVTLYASWLLGSAIRSVWIAVACSGGIIAASVVSGDGFSWPPWIGAELLLVVVGRTLHRQDLLVDELEAARGALADQAVADERRRIARELHDVAGHTLAAVMLHVTGARHVLRRDPDEAERALLDAEEVGRASMDQIRVTVESLRTSERGVDPPLPAAGAIESLVEEYRRAGLSIEASIDPGIVDLLGEIGLAVHRICREALANVARHAPDNRVVLVARSDDGGVNLECSDHGRPADPSWSRRSRVGGFGVVGMAERARALGGDLSAGPTSDGWQVVAFLPFVQPSVTPLAGRGRQ